MKCCRCLFVTIPAFAVLFLCGCKAIPTNTPVAIGAPLKQNAPSRPTKIGIQPEFNTSVSALFISSTDKLVEDIAEMLNRQNHPLSFTAIPSFSVEDRPDLDYILKLSCVTASKKNTQDPFLMGLGLPATFSVVGAPLGIAALSVRGAEIQENKFEWKYHLLNRGGKYTKISPQFCCVSRVSATGWGIPEETVADAFRITRNELYNNAVVFLNGINWDSAEAGSANIPLPVSAAITGGEKMFAIIVGVSSYKHSQQDHGLTRLNYADNDAVGFYDQLITLGWKKENIRLLIDDAATEDAITETCKDWAARARNETLVVYWSGHAYPDIADPERVFLACYDSQTHRPSTAIEMGDFRRHLARHEAHNVILFADTCHSGNIISRGDSKGLAIRPALDAMKKHNEIPKGWIIVASADSDRSAYEDKAWSHGAMTYAILNGLTGEADGCGSGGNRDRLVTLGELKSYVTREMGSETLKTTGVKLEPLFYTTSADSSIWNLTLIPRD